MVFPQAFFRPGSTVKLYFSRPSSTVHCIFWSKKPGQKPWSKTWPKIWSKIQPKIRARRPCIKNPAVRFLSCFCHVFAIKWVFGVPWVNSDFGLKEIDMGYNFSKSIWPTAWPVGGTRKHFMVKSGFRVKILDLIGFSSILPPGRQNPANLTANLNST